MSAPIRTLFLSLVLACLVCAFGSCAPVDDRPHVTVYVSADEYVARPILDLFEQRTGIEVRALFDTEATKTTGLVTRLHSEKARPRADLFWSSECFGMIQLQQQGVLGRFPSDQLAVMNQGVPESWQSRSDSWVAFAPRARVLVYAPDRIDPESLPRDWEALTDPEWKGRLAMADPRFGTTGGHLGAMQAVWGGERFRDWINGLVANDTKVLTSGNAGVVAGVASGEFDLGMTDTDDVWAAQAQGHTVALIYPRHATASVSGGGTLLIPNTVGLIDGGPNPSEALELATWLSSAEVERLLMETPSRNIPLRSDPGALAVPDPLQVRFEKASTLRIPALQTARDLGLLEAR
ncbi:MAG: hypothetical protein CBC35_03675 [Planctomycetes bacterium TMED75]|nr:iron ABC transporter substrate-binding protein [Planctomycetaceae bacterium]OUU94673.1 MAG: hypothetical protein CBC35_03675 [Planctomycetes bacterium TMED75]